MMSTEISTSTPRPARPELPKVALIGCGKAKGEQPAQALTLYTGRLFRAAADFATATHDEVFVVSALHGLIDAEHVVEPYNVSLDDLRARGVDLAAWGRDVVRTLREKMGDVPIAVTVLMGERYARWIRPELHARTTTACPEAERWPEVRYPLHKIAGVGPRVRWLRDALDDAGGLPC